MMRFQIQSVVVIFVVLFALVATNEAIPTPEPEFHPINITDPYVIELANFAVTVYNKRKSQVIVVTPEYLKFEKVIDAEVLSLKYGNGNYYRLDLSANNGTTSNNYTAYVIDMPLKHFRNLFTFNPSKPNA
ncbi:hypothetical protein TSUD_252840 [Trifolium subterraneum]|nr:hypothetical protein TSUD_252840 [Trifolium subterraneum]